MRLGLLRYVYKLWLRIRRNLERSREKNTLSRHISAIQTVIQIHLQLS